MDMKQYLMDRFKFNDLMNTKLLAKMRALPDKQQCIKLFSHLINSQNKWMARLAQYPQDPKMDWWEPVYALNELEYEWGKSLRPWIEFIGSKSEDDLLPK